MDMLWHLCLLLGNSFQQDRYSEMPRRGSSSLQDKVLLLLHCTWEKGTEQTGTKCTCYLPCFCSCDNWNIAGVLNRHVFKFISWNSSDVFPSLQLDSCEHEVGGSSLCGFCWGRGSDWHWGLAGMHGVVCNPSTEHAT